jgi:hypothetical protein
MDITLKFKSGETLEIRANMYTTINIQRTGKITNINITNDDKDFYFTTLFDRLVELQEDTPTFDITVKTDADAEAVYSGMTANYYGSDVNEILHFTSEHING